MINQPEFLQTLAKLTLPQIVAAHAERFGDDKAAIREKAYGIWHSISWREYLAYVRKVAMGLSALGLSRGENVGIVTNNHPEWLFTEIGAQAAGAVTLNLFTSSVASELVTSLNRIQATFVVVQDQEQIDKLLDNRAKLKHVRYLIYIDPTGMRGYEGDSWVLSFKELLEQGDRYDRENPEKFPQELKKGRSGDTALMIQTSGTTGLSKLAMISHRNMSGMGVKWVRSQGIEAGENWLSMSPPALDRRPDVGRGCRPGRGDDDELPRDHRNHRRRFPGDRPVARHHLVPFLGGSRFQDPGEDVRCGLCQKEALRYGRAGRAQGGGVHRRPQTGLPAASSPP